MNKSWLPKRNARSGRLSSHVQKSDDINVIERSDNIRVNLRTLRVTNDTSLQRALSGKIELPNGKVIVTVRKDIMDSALKRSGRKHDDKKS
jgi:hypothetical protein